MFARLHLFRGGAVERSETEGVYFRWIFHNYKASCEQFDFTLIISLSLSTTTNFPVNSLISRPTQFLFHITSTKILASSLK